ncbi:hypothetical protein MPK66_gp318 [Erwinia phage pEa_SNUABM_2]|uniref:Uncharacterized protein n=1 Tax=Erwinia phage pEa_SNUABM_2 TaxID=2869547 RepID=A0AAE8C1N4_9CAUD|nr:hypothetical protein MPK66_gp318 [Erwinia phage pEa_SNUABM_2]QZE59562.1 hypothetical protein pEaSNUABM2_00318 [Erwinia phage pEa_SNUABM_2]QZE59899.1 hypothetical protein pEaSNUABM39_00319 [Erwinia phage pEa_SNUABM_39]
MSNANKILLNARVRRLDGTSTYINKVNANGYSTDAKGPQIPVKRIVFAGKTLKEIEAPFEKGEYVIVQGVAVKLNKRQQRELADNTLDEKALRPDFGRLAFIDRDDGKATDGKKVKPKAEKKEGGLKATRKQNGDKRTKKERKAEKANLKDDLDFIASDKIDRKAELAHIIDATIEDCNTKERRKLLSDSFDMDWKDIKKHGGKGVVKHMGRKAAQAAVNKMSATVTQDAFIKQMPAELKRLIADRRLVLNKRQIEAVLSALGLDVKFYNIAMQTLLGNLSLAVDDTLVKPKAEKPAKLKKHKQAKPQYLTEKDQQRRMKKMKVKLLAPTEKGMKKAKAHLKQAKVILANKLGITSKEIKRGLIAYRPNGVDYMFVASDARGPIFIDKHGDPCVYTYENLEATFDFTLNKPSELDATV